MTCNESTKAISWGKEVFSNNGAEISRKTWGKMTLGHFV